MKTKPDRKTGIEQVLQQARKIDKDLLEVQQAWRRLCRELEFMSEPEARPPRFNRLLNALWIAASNDQS